MNKILKSEHIKTINQLGLNKIQSTLYLTSLKYGVLSALELSRITNINRQQIYTETEDMVKQGIYELTQKKRKKYIPANPTKLISIARLKSEEANTLVNKITSIVPELKEMYSTKTKDIKVQYFEGSQKIRDAFEMELTNSKNTEIASLVGSLENSFEFLSESYWDKWNRKFTKNNSTTRMLVHESELAQKIATLDKKYKRETRYLKNFPMKVNIDIFNNTVLIVSYHDQIAIWIDSVIVSQSYRLMFNLLWEQSNKFK